jgi:hypothetical protein
MMKRVEWKRKRGGMIAGSTGEARGKDKESDGNAGGVVQ